MLPELALEERKEKENEMNGRKKIYVSHIGDELYKSARLRKG